MKVLHSNQIFLLFVAGVLALYSSVIWCFHRFAAFALLSLTGAACTLLTIFLASQHPVQPIGVVLLFIVTALFAAEFFWSPAFVAGVAGAALLPAAFACLYAGNQRISNGLAIPFGLLLGLVTAYLCAIGKRARLNKLSDI